MYRVLPWWRQILIASLLHVEGVEPDIDRVRIAGHEVQLGVFPMGVDAEHFTALAGDSEVEARVQEIRRDSGIVKP